jgi:hypothetical protein
MSHSSRIQADLDIIAQTWKENVYEAPFPATPPEPWQVLAIANAHPNDELVRFKENGHEYALSNGEGWADSSRIQSVTSLLKTYVESFSDDPNAQRYMEAQAARGNKLHLLIERFFNGDVPTPEEISEGTLDMTHEWNCFMRFVEKHPQIANNVYRTEWSVGNPSVLMVGCIDCFVVTERHEDGSPKTGIVIDWKTTSKRESMYNKRITNRSVKFERSEGMTKLEKYLTQACLYASILEDHYKIKISHVMIVTFSKDYRPEEYDRMVSPDDHFRIGPDHPVQIAAHDLAIRHNNKGGIVTETMSQMVCRMLREDLASMFQGRRAIHRGTKTEDRIVALPRSKTPVIVKSLPQSDSEEEDELQDNPMVNFSSQKTLVVSSKKNSSSQRTIHLSSLSQAATTQGLPDIQYVADTQDIIVMQERLDEHAEKLEELKFNIHMRKKQKGSPFAPIEATPMQSTESTQIVEEAVEPIQEEIPATQFVHNVGELF